VIQPVTYADCCCCLAVSICCPISTNLNEHPIRGGTARRPLCQMRSACAPQKPLGLGLELQKKPQSVQRFFPARWAIDYSFRKGAENQA